MWPCWPLHLDAEVCRCRANEQLSVCRWWCRWDLPGCSPRGNGRLMLLLTANIPKSKSIRSLSSDLVVRIGSSLLNRLRGTVIGYLSTRRINPSSCPNNTICFSCIFNAAGLNRTQSSPNVAPCAIDAKIRNTSRTLALPIFDDTAPQPPREHWSMQRCCSSLHFASCDNFGVGR